MRSKVRTLTLFIGLVFITACADSSERPNSNIDPEHVQTYSRIVKEIYNDVPFSQDGVFYMDQQSGKITVGLKNENENTKDLKNELRKALKDKVEFVEVSYSRSDLNRILNTTQSKHQDITEAGIQMSQVGINVSEQKIDFVFNEFDPQKLKNQKEVEKFIQQILSKEEQKMLRVTYDPEMKNQIGG